MEKGRASVLILFGALALPYFTVLRWDFANLNEAVRSIPLYIYTILGLATISSFVLGRDRILGWFSLYLCAYVIFVRNPYSLSVALWIVIGLLMLTLLKELPEDLILMAEYLLIVSACFQVVLAIVQSIGYDPFYFGFKKAPFIFIHGTTGHHNFLGAFLAMIIPSAPLLVLPFLLVGLILSKSALSFVAAWVGLLIRYRKNSYFWMLSLVYLALMIYLFGDKSWDSYYTRKDAWLLALGDMDVSWRFMLFGKGLGAWFVNIPSIQANLDYKEPMAQAHSEYIQFIYELGFVGIMFLTWWLWENKRMFKNGSVCAIAVSAVGIFNFHLAYLAMTALVLLALALRTKKEEKEEVTISCQEINSANSSAYYV